MPHVHSSREQKALQAKTRHQLWDVARASGRAATAAAAGGRLGSAHLQEERQVQECWRRTHCPWHCQQQPEDQQQPGNQQQHMDQQQMADHRPEHLLPFFL